MIVREGPEVAIVSLGLDELAHEPGRHCAQGRIIRQAAGQHAGREVLARELSRPGNRLFIGRFPVAQPHHFQHPGISVGSGDKPVVNDTVEPCGHRAFKAHVYARHCQI